MGSHESSVLSWTVYHLWKAGPYNTQPTQQRSHYEPNYKQQTLFAKDRGTDWFKSQIPFTLLSWTNPIHIALLDQFHSHCSLGPIPVTLLSWTNSIHIALLDQSQSHCSFGLIPFTLLSLGPIPFTSLSWTNPIHMALIHQSLSHLLSWTNPIQMALLDRSHSHGSLGPYLSWKPDHISNQNWVVPTFERYQLVGR
jgi:hypothetical protein